MFEEMDVHVEASDASDTMNTSVSSQMDVEVITPPKDLQAIAGDVTLAAADAVSNANMDAVSNAITDLPKCWVPTKNMTAEELLAEGLSIKEYCRLKEKELNLIAAPYKFKVSVANYFEVGDLVWAKMKSCRIWPGKIIETPAECKSKKNHHYVFFFGSNNYACIAEEKIQLHSEQLLEKYGRKTTGTFQSAVDTIVELSNPKSQPSSSSSISTPKKLKKLIMNKPSSDKNLSLVEMSAENCTTHTISSSLTDVHNYDHPDTPSMQVSEDEVLKEKKIEPKRKKIGFLGLGKISHGIRRNVHRSGHSVIMWNQARMQCEDFAEKFEMQILDSPADVVKAADITFCCVSHSVDFKQIVRNNGGSLKNMSEHEKRKGFVDLTSVDPERSESISCAIGMIGGRYLEAPLIGSTTDAKEGTLLLLAAGDESLYEECKSCFDDISKSHLFVGNVIGTASKLRIIHNLLLGTMYATVAEALALVKEIDFNGESFLKIFIYNVNIKNMCDEVLAMINKKYGLNASLMQAHRDLDLGLSFAKRLQLTSPIFDAAKEVCNRFKNNKLQTKPSVQA